MNALFIPRFLREKASFMAALISLTVWVHPQALVLATANETLEQNQLVFEVKNLNLQSSAKGLQLVDIVNNDPLVNNLKIYLQKHNSPLEPFASEIIKQPQWQRALAISWVESNFCRRHADNNCSGIGVAPGHKLWRKYATHLDWFKDMSALMEKPIYKEKYTTFKKMKGVYVQPGSMKWVNGAQKKYDELTRLTEESEEQKQVAILQATEKIALATFAESVRFE